MSGMSKFHISPQSRQVSIVYSTASLEEMGRVLYEPAIFYLEAHRYNYLPFNGMVGTVLYLRNFNKTVAANITNPST
jgi:hypothetical protein